MHSKNSYPDVGYVPYSSNLSHPADRRRIGAWAKYRKVRLNTNHPEKSDITVLSNAANFGKWMSKCEGKIVLDLVDGYLGEEPSFTKDFLRNCLRTLNGTSSLRWITYTRHVRYACMGADAIVVASQEQLQSIAHLNNRISIIPDIHFEIESAAKEMHTNSEQANRVHQNISIFWEGFGYTLKNLESIAMPLDDFLSETMSTLYLVTNVRFPRWGGFLGRIDTKNLVNSWFPKSSNLVEIIPWSIENLIMYSKKSNFGIIPINLNDKFAMLKSENKLLSMWRLGLVTFFSPIPSYSRVALNAGLKDFCIADNQWEEVLRSVASNRIDFEKSQNLASVFLEENYSFEGLLSKWDIMLRGVASYD
jgi:hypothetical protein